MSESDKKELYAQLNDKLAAADAALKEVTDFADLHQLSFTYHGPSYGMGGWYSPRKAEQGPRPKYGETGYWDYEEAGWSASSHSC